ncbi:hypothetical protein X975_16815, partial [Stegodyphus mimosarum]
MVLQTFTADTPYYYPQQQPRRRRKLNATHKSLIIWHAIAACYYLCSSFCTAEMARGNFELVDLSHVFDNTTIYWVTEKPLFLNVTFNGTVPGKGYWYQKDEIYAATHGGTHLDAPCHFAVGRWCVSDIPLKRLVVPAVVIDISHYVKEDPDIHLTKDHLIEWESKYGEIPDESLLFVKTGWSRYWPDPATYTGTTERNASLLKFPSIKPEAAKWLTENRKIVGVGIDSMSMDVPNQGVQTHITLNEKNIYGLENVNNLDALPPKGATAYVMPMKLKAASGAPCRIVAQIPHDLSNGVATMTYTSNWIFIMVLAFLFTYWTQ